MKKTVALTVCLTLGGCAVHDGQIAYTCRAFVVSQESGLNARMDLPALVLGGPVFRPSGHLTPDKERDAIAACIKERG